MAVFALLVGWAPSIGRAVVMGGIGLAGVAMGRPRDRGATMAVAALILLALNPAVLFDIGFQLSFAATWGLLFLAPALCPHLEAWTRWLGGASGHVAEALSVTVGAHLAVAPLLALHFQAVPVAGLIANLLAVPLVVVVVPAGLALLPVVATIDAAGAWALALLRPGLAALLWITGVFARTPWTTLVTPPVPPSVAAACYVVLGGGVALASGSWRPPRWQVTCATAAGLALFAAWYVGAVRPPPGLVVTALDVGQGDAVLVQSPSGRTVLIDGGGEPGGPRGDWDVGRMRVVPALRHAGVRRLDVILLTHPHEDHVGGLPAVVENFPVGLVLDSGVPHPSPSYLRLLRMTEAGRIAYRKAREGQTVELGSGVRLSILYPPDFPPTVEGDPVHARSVMARLTYGRAGVLLAGDIEGPVERYLIDRGAVPQSQVLKVGHHGSRTSTTRVFLAQVRPQIAVISVGAGNGFGHPHQSTLDALAAMRIAVYRTDHDGAVRLTSDGATFRVETTRAPQAGDARFR
jgi:competence protein ComEC